MYQGTEFKLNDFSGGMVSNMPITELELTQASAVDNIIVFPKGRGFRSRLGDTTFNSTAMNSGANLQGLAYYRQADQTEYIVAVCGAKIFSSPMTGTMTDRTGAVSITAGQDDIWDLVPFNNKIVAFGGASNSPDAPWAWTGSGNAAALGGTPPSAYGAFQANNRMFAFRTSANPSRIYWSVLSNEADWTGVGSGNADVFTNDNDRLTAAAVLNTNTVLLFKENSTHQMQIGNLISGAFPIFPLFLGTGCAGKHAVVVADGYCYFITSQGKMKITDGVSILTEQDLPALSHIDDQWNGTNASRLQYVQGIRHTGKDFDHIKWIVSYGSSQTTHNECFIWDIQNKCWLQNTTGWAMNVATRKTDGTVYTGGYNGKIYQKEVAATYTDASNTSAVVNAYWQSGWVNSGKFETVKQLRKVSISLVTQTSGTVTFYYGFDFSGLTKSISVDQSAASGFLLDTSVLDVNALVGVSLTMKSSRLTGRGNFFQFKINSPTTAYPLQFNGLTFSGKEYGQKAFSAR